MEATLKIIKTKDGSHSLYLSELDETYHSSHGALQESTHVFINAGLEYILLNNPDRAQIKVLEFGFGTGLNALLTAQRASKKVSIHYDTIDKYPLPFELTKSLNYGEILGKEGLFETIHRTEWEKKIEIMNSFYLKKMKVDFRKFDTIERYHLIYFDAFAPSKQPELWDKTIFETCYELLVSDGLLITYSAKGQLKRDLKAIGFEVESLPGPPGKFEITRAIKK